MRALLLLTSLLLLIATSSLAQSDPPLAPGQAPEGTIAATSDPSASRGTPTDEDSMEEPGAVGEGKMRWLATAPVAGQQVHVRLRGKALQAALDGQRWELHTSGTGKSTTLESEFELVPNLHEVSAALGPMRSGPSGESHWPLLLESERLPIKKLKLRVKAPDSMELPSIQLARMNHDGSVADIVAEMPEPPASLTPLEPGPIWLEPVAQIRPEVWAVVVRDEGQPLQLQRVTAYAAELCLSFTMPAVGEPVLHIAEAVAGKTEAAMPTTAVAPVQIVGEVESFAPTVPKSSFLPSIFGGKKTSRKTIRAGTAAGEDGQSADSSLFLGVVLGALGMALVIGGMSLLRRKLSVD